MRVGAALVLNEVFGLRELADVVVVAAHAGEQRVGTDRLGGSLRQVGHRQRVLERPRRLDRQPLEQGQIGVGELEQSDVGDRPGHRLQSRHQEARQHGREHAAGRRRRDLRGDHRAVGEPALPQHQTEHRERIDAGDDQAGTEEDVAFLEPLRHEGGAETRDQRVDGDAHLATEEHRDENGLHESEEHRDRHTEHQPGDDRTGGVRQRRQVHVEVAKLLANDARGHPAGEECGRPLEQQHEQRHQDDRAEPVAELLGRWALPLEVKEPGPGQQAHDHDRAEQRERVERRPVAGRERLQQPGRLRRDLVAAPNQDATARQSDHHRFDACSGSQPARQRLAAILDHVRDEQPYQQGGEVRPPAAPHVGLARQPLLHRLRQPGAAIDEAVDVELDPLLQHAGDAQREAAVGGQQQVGSAADDTLAVHARDDLVQHRQQLVCKPRRPQRCRLL